MAPSARAAPASSPGAATGESFDVVHDVVAPSAWGGVAGLGLAIALVKPRLVVVSTSDETTTLLAISTGIALGFLVRATEGTRHHGRLRVTGGSSTAQYWEYAVAYRAPVVDRIALEAAVVLGSESWMETVRETRCSGFFCWTGDFVVDSRDEQFAAAMFRVAVEPFPDSRWMPTLAVGAGPSRARVKRYTDPTEERVGPVFDATLGVEPGGLTGELGFRFGALDTAAPRSAAVYFRVGYTWGEP